MTDGGAKKRVRNLGDSLQWNEMPHIQQGRKGMESWAILHLTRNMLGESGLSTTATTRAEFHFGLILIRIPIDSV